MARPKVPDPAIKRSISLPADLYKRMKKRMAEYGFTSESAYFQLLARNDVVADQPPTIIREERPAPKKSPQRRTSR